MITGMITPEDYLAAQRLHRQHAAKRGLVISIIALLTGITLSIISGDHKLKETDELLLLYHADNIFEMFPKRWFPEPGLLDEFRAFASVVGKPGREQM